MKTFNLLFVLSIFVFASCETADMADNQNNADLRLTNDANTVLIDEDPNESRFRFSAVINGSSFIADDFEIIQTGDLLLMEGQKGDNAIVLQLPADIVTGDYNIGSSIGTGNDFSAAVTLNVETQQITLGSLNVIDLTADTGKINGSLTILNHDTAQKTLKGIFEFKVGSTEITQGIFEVKY
ncbi:MAG: hypothetical protein EBY38_05145 [Flavobacteriaceae bacterium]|nr:hypothetical protein [Flavobacteriaceae bacterium]